MKRGSHWAAFPLAFMAVVVLLYATAVAIGNTAALLGLKRWAETLACVGTGGIILGGIAAALWLQTSRQERFRARVREGLCVYCGFDLRASHLHCPECGRRILEHLYLGRRQRGEGERSPRAGPGVTAPAPTGRTGG